MQRAMMAQLRVDFQGRGKVETFPRARVQPIGNGVQLTLDIAPQVGAFGQVLAQQAIRMLVSAALPGTVRITKEDLDREPLGQLLVLSQLFPSIIRQSFTLEGRHMAEFLDEALTGTPSVRPVHLAE